MPERGRQVRRPLIIAVAGLAGLVCFVACATDEPGSPLPLPSALRDAGSALDVDAPADDASLPFDAGGDTTEPTDAASSFATYRIEVGSHTATVTGGTPSNPVAGFTTVPGRDFDFKFDSSARYVLLNPVQPNDQNDWSKLPGFSDCGQLDLAQYGAMFGWRWRLDRSPKMLEVTAYANVAGTHATKLPPMLELSEAELAAEAPLRYRVFIDGAAYRFSIKGTIGQRTIDVSTSLARGCAATGASTLKWASGLYFGGTSTAPSVITAKIYERPF